MNIAAIVIQIAGGLCMFLYGMEVMSEGLQQAAGGKMQKALGFMTGNRFIGVLTGLGITAIIQSSSAVTVMVVSFVNAGLLNLTQSIGVIMGANIGTTVTAWIVSLIGFKLKIAAFALPAIGIGFVLRAVKWKHKLWGEALLGFGLLFMGLEYLSTALPKVTPEQMAFIDNVSRLGFVSVLIGVAIGTVVTLIMHSSSASTALVITLAHSGLIDFWMAAAIILGANIGTTIDAAMAALGAKTAARRAALVHVLFNVFGVVLAVIFFKPLGTLVDVIVPGPANGAGIAAHLAMYHTVFNTLNTLILLPFVNQIAALVTIMIRDKDEKAAARKTYKLDFQLSPRTSPELALIRAEKEVRDMAALAADMFGGINTALGAMSAAGKADVDALILSLRDGEAYADEMREEITRFLIELTARHVNAETEHKISYLLRVAADLEDMCDNSYGIGFLLEQCVKKDRVFKSREMEELLPYAEQVEHFLAYVRENLGKEIGEEQRRYAGEVEAAIDKSRNRLRKLGRKRLEAGKDVKTELLFIDLVRRIEKQGDYCYSITEAARG